MRRIRRTSVALTLATITPAMAWNPSTPSPLTQTDQTDPAFPLPGLHLLLSKSRLGRGKSPRLVFGQPLRCK